jgi:hypothetical protein
LEWNHIALLSKNQLGNLAKVSINERGEMHKICLYTYDFKDVRDVFRVLVTLRRMNHIENDFLEYVTEVHDVEEAVNGEDFKRRMEEPSKESIVSIYSSPPVGVWKKTIETIKMYHLLNIGSDSKVGLVAQLKKNFTINSEEIIIFYNPPIQIQITVPTRSLETPERSLSRELIFVAFPKINFFTGDNQIFFGSSHNGRLLPEFFSDFYI